MADLLQWDLDGERYFEGGISKVVLFRKDSVTYGPGIAWSGVTGIDESPEGGDANEIFADNRSYAKIRGRERFNFSINAFQYPPEFEECDGSVRPANGVILGQQQRKEFGLCYRTEIGADDLGDFSKGYKIHLVYGCSTSPVQKTHETLNDSPDAETFSWTCESTPVAISNSFGNFKPVAHIVIDSRTVNAAKLAQLEGILYGTAAVTGANPSAAVQSRIVLPDELLTMFEVSNVAG